jgi:FixJ family two-component response regulator
MVSMDLLAAAESLCSAKYLSLEVTSGLPIIAIIDDDPDILEALDLMLSSHGCRSALFASAEDFLDTAATSEATCLVVDIQLGGMSVWNWVAGFPQVGSHSRSSS